MSRIILRILERPDEMGEVEALQRTVWPADDADIVPSHLLTAASQNGGLVIGAYASASDGGGPPEEPADDEADELLAFAELPAGAKLVGFVFGFPGLYFTPDGPRPKHASHMLGVLPEYRDQGIGFHLKRAQWQMVRRQGLDRVTWTYDPLLSRNAYLNITRLGAVCSTYIRDAYGSMRDELNAGLPTDRFHVDWWINSQRVNRRLSKRARVQLDLAHFLSAGTAIVNPSEMGEDGMPRPAKEVRLNAAVTTPEAALPDAEQPQASMDDPSLLMVEIPADFQALRAMDAGLAFEWRMHTREIFEKLFASGYLVTDVVYLTGKYARSFYVLSHGESTL